MKIVEAGINKSTQIKKNCDLLLRMIGEVNTGVKRKIEQIKSLEDFGDNKATAGQLDDLREDLDKFITDVMNLRV